MSPPTQYNPARLDEMAKHGISVIVSGYFGADVRKVSSIENDYLTAMRDAMNHLYSRGHRDIAYLSGLSRTMTFDLRAQGYLAMVDALKLPTGDSLLVDGVPTFGTSTSDGYALARRLLALKKTFTAVICVNDLTALGAYNAFREAGLRIPEDVAVIGFDNIPFCDFVTPTLTTLALDSPAFGKKAFDLLHMHMTHGTTGFYLNRLNLVERQSTAIGKSSFSIGEEAKNIVKEGTDS
jgi:DNA-binding LacI/PurR family transcriptional regulator